jgi:hypothetical protein
MKYMATNADDLLVVLGAQGEKLPRGLHAVQVRVHVGEENGDLPGDGRS